MATTIDPTYLLSNYQSQTKTTGSNTLGKDDFLKLLMTQLQNQDPTSPMDNSQFISQMATFSSLEQLTNLNNTMQNFVDSQTQNGLLQASMLIGKTVTYLNDQQQEQSAPVQAVSFKNGQVLFQLNDGSNSQISSSQIIKVE